MTVFKGYMKITKRLSGMIIMYLVIFTGVTISMQFAGEQAEEGSYAAEKLNIAVVDQDGGDLAKGLAAFLKENHHVEYMKNDPEVMQEALYYETVDLIVRIPEQFEEKCLDGEETLPITKVPGTYNAIYASQQINTFLNQVRTYKAAGYSVAEASEKCREQKTSEVNLLDKSKTTGEVKSYGYTFRYMPYLFLTAVCYVLGMILASFQKKEVKNRMIASAVSLRRQNGESILAFLVVGGVIWLFSMMGILAMNGKAFLEDPYKWYYIVNSLLLMLVCLAISMVLGLLVNKPTVINNIVTPLSLGMCFLCGAFVQMSLLGKSVLKVSRFLPVYWYEVVNETLGTCITMTDSIRRSIIRGFGIQLLFAVALVGIALAVSKFKQQEQ
ncbi:ABC transporter permease [Hespellia stercorisuis]|uniref:ABC-2 type transport system permease protein n=1 Tax=Hespellia stercorisuis DSM 15480 TaxID=1121950 RepID=A0A1M6TS97_9FIRM|nr:ABC transporter permease [Hespellia stercorisuis]SHK59688.1 ABC-2 type transport system permease protein [Hespellia stercorisuis DSM 15480]